MNYMNKISQILENGFKNVEIVKILDNGDTLKKEYNQKTIKAMMEIMAEVANIQRVINTNQGLLTLEEADLLEKEDKVILKWSSKIDSLIWITRVTINK